MAVICFVLFLFLNATKFWRYTAHCTLPITNPFFFISIVLLSYALKPIYIDWNDYFPFSLIIDAILQLIIYLSSVCPFRFVQCGHTFFLLSLSFLQFYCRWFAISCKLICISAGKRRKNMNSRWKGRRYGANRIHHRISST